METDNQKENKSIDRPWLWKKGQSGNLKGRPKGKTLKEYARDYLACLTDEERDNFMEGLPKELIWKMAEGNPKQDTDVTSDGKSLPIPILNVQFNNSDKENPRLAEEN